MSQPQVLGLGSEAARVLPATAATAVSAHLQASSWIVAGFALIAIVSLAYSTAHITRYLLNKKK